MVEHCHSLEEFSDILHRQYLGTRVMVIFASSEESLRGIVSLRDFLNDTKIILVLPDEKKDTMAMGFALFPRFITWLDSDLNELGAVLKKMLDLYDTPYRMKEVNYDYISIQC